MPTSKCIPMIQIGDTLISSDCLDQCFCCDLDLCHGICCAVGDAGAPLTECEEVDIRNSLSIITPLLTQKSRETIIKQGVSYIDSLGDLVTSLVDTGECVFAISDEKKCLQCAFQKLTLDSSKFLKPLSCHLYPIRVTQIGKAMALNYDRRPECQPAVAKGEKIGLPVYQFLRQPLIRLFGESWFHDLEQVVNSLTIEGNLRPINTLEQKSK